MSQNWEADKMLDVYIHDYMLKRKMHASAKAFMTEGKVATDPVAIDAPGGFLLEWWSVFWDIFIARTNEKHSESAATYIETQQIKAKEHQQKMQMQQLHLMQQRNAHLQRRDSSHHPPLGASVNADVMMMGKPPASSTLGLKMQEELMKSATNQQGLLIPGSSQNVSSTLQQIQGRPEIKQEVNLGDSQKPLTTDPSSFYRQAILQSKSGLGGVGFNQGVTSFPLKGWPLTGIDNLHPGMGVQVQKPNMHNQNQFYLASQQQQPSYGLVGLPRGSQSQSMKDSQPTRNDGPVGSPGQMNSPKINMAQMQQSTSQRQDQLQQQQSNRKRKQHSSCGPTNSTGTGNTPGPDGVVSSTNQVDDIGQFGDDSVESFLQQEGGDGREVYGAMKQQTVTQHKAESSKGFSFTEVGCIQTRKKVLCCHFSSDGNLLASAGHDKKAVIWNMDTLQTETTPEEHELLITDIRFRPNSTQFGTTSLDQSVRIWDASNPSYCLHAHTGHTSHIMSLDFHPNKTDLFCFSDSKNEIHYWNMNPFQCTRVSKGGSAQVRFQPRSGQLLASASNKVVSIFDVKTDTQTHSLQAHTGTVNYICWDINGEYLASLSDDTVRVWSVASGECIHELNASDNQFYSCIFHPSYSALLVIGGMRSLELWNMAENKTMSVLAHDDIIAALAHSPVTGMVASSSHDTSVKLWN